MAQPELGSKRVCVSCGTRFYDLTKDPAVCPKCGAEQPAEVPRLKRSGDSIPVAPIKPSLAENSEVDDDIDIDTDDDDDDDSVLEDASDLDDDDDDISSDIDVSADKDEHDS